MTEGVLRRLATLTNVKRAREYDAVREQRNNGRDARAAVAVAKLEKTVEELKTELGLPS